MRRVLPPSPPPSAQLPSYNITVHLNQLLASSDSLTRALSRLPRTTSRTDDHGFASKALVIGGFTSLAYASAYVFSPIIS